MSMTVSQAGAAQTAQMAQPMTGASGSMSAPPQQKMSDLFAKIDTTQSGSISQSQFSQAFDTMKPPAVFQLAGKSAVWNALDPQGTGQVSKSDLVSTMKSLMVQLRNPGDTSSAQTTAPSSLASSDISNSDGSFFI